MTDQNPSEAEIAKVVGDQFNQTGDVILQILTLIHGEKPELPKTRDTLMKLINEVFMSYLFVKRGISVDRVQNELGQKESREKLISEVVAQTDQNELGTALVFAVAQVTNSYFNTVRNQITPEIQDQITSLLKEKIQ